MSQAGRAQRRRGIGRMGRIAAAVLAAFLAAPVVAGMSPADAQSRTPAGSATLSISVVSVSPSIPTPSEHLKRLRIELSITNHTNAPLRNVQITATRGLPLTSSDGLSASLAHPSAPISGQPVAPVHPVTINVPPADESAAVTTKFVTTTAVPVDLNPGLCLCANGQVYPVWFGAYGTVNGASQLLGQTQTFVPSFYNRPNRLQVSWVWPLIDRPHRLVGSTVFTDDSLATSVSTGRLSRCLQVLQNVAGTVPVTVVIDPELLDELEVMATQRYTYRTPSGQLARGTGQQAARAWLAQLQTVLKTDNQVSVVLTPNADPDVDSLARAQLSWSATLPAAEQQRVTAALGGITPSSGFAWPPSGTIGRAALRELYGTGVRSLLLSSQSVRPNVASDTPLTLAELANGGHPVVAALNPPDLARYVATAVEGNPAEDPSGSPDGGSTGSGMPALMAHLALLAGADNPAGEQVFLVPPRYVDPAVSLATDAVESSSSSVLTQPANLLNVLDAAGTAPLQGAPVAVPAHLVPPLRLPAGLPPKNLAVIARVTNEISSLKAMFDGSAAALGLINDLYDGVQRLGSAAWRHGTGLGGRRLGIHFARQLRIQVHQLMTGVHIVVPASRKPRYTLASTNSPLPITVENDLPYPVHIKVAVRTVKGIPGLNAGVFGPQEIPPNSKTTLHVPTQVQRSGLFRVYAVLQTPDGQQQIGPRVHLLVTSTALGTIGVVITVVSGTILVLALLIRFLRRMRAGRGGPERRRRWFPAGATAGSLHVEAPVAPLTETLATPGAAPPPAAPGH